jgi:mannose-6-phosphate isomerase-like protein (cupin superfamily)
MPFVETAGLPTREPLPGWTGRFFNSEHMTFCYYDIAADATPLHEHHHEQEEVWHVTEGRLALTVDGEERVLGAGDVAVVPANHRHSARAVTACRAIVVDFPLRESIRGIRITVPPLRD